MNLAPLIKENNSKKLQILVNQYLIVLHRGFHSTQIQIPLVKLNKK
jgi:DUF2075 family protein